jgi:hypothetical protein
MIVASPSQELPWTDLPQRWGHPWHSMCSYLGAFPAALARSFISMLTEPGDVVLDPFSGRGTTLLESRMTGRIPLASDLNPIANALTRAKNVSVSVSEVLARIEQLERRYDALLYHPEALSECDEIQLIFHPKVLAQLCYLRRKLQSSHAPADEFLIGVLLGAMHGRERQDGSSAYASISMPNTFSMSPEYVRRYVETKRLQRVERDLFGILRDRSSRLLGDDQRLKAGGIVATVDSRSLDTAPAFAAHRGNVKLVLTSPPYLGVVNYALQNWIRAWFLVGSPASSPDELDDNLTLSEWLDFAEKTVRAVKNMLRDDGVAVFVIGDVAKSSNTLIPLAREFIRRVVHSGLFAYVGCLSDRIPADIKTTRIWRETKGRATSVDRLVVLANAPPLFRTHHLALELYGDSARQIAPLLADEIAAHARIFSGEM